MAYLGYGPYSGSIQGIAVHPSFSTRFLSLGDSLEQVWQYHLGESHAYNCAKWYRIHILVKSLILIVFLLKYFISNLICIFIYLFSPTLPYIIQSLNKCFFQIIMTSLPCNTCSIYTCIQISHHSTSLNRKFDQLTCWAWNWSYLRIRRGIIRAKNLHNDLSTYIQSLRSTPFCQNSFLFRNFTGI